MLIKVKKNWKDFAEGHKGLTRRDFLSKGFIAGAMSVALPELLIREAAAATLSCPPPTLVPGAIAQIFSEGGPTMGARFISEAQAASMNSAMAANYGISGAANLVKLGPNFVVDSTSPFGFVLMQGPPGYAGGAAAWQTNVLAKVSAGGHLGPFNADDGAGENTGLLGGVSPFKISQMAKDIKIGNSVTLAKWAQGLPAASVSGGNLQPSSLAKTFTLTPAATGLTNSNAIKAVADTANTLVQALSNAGFNTVARKGGAQMLQSAGCAFYGNAPMASSTFGTTLFTPTGITALTSKFNVAGLSNEEQAQVAAYYQSAVGVAGGVITQFNGRDYHGGDPQNEIAPKDIEEARAIVMFLAACDAAQAPGAMIYLANGQAIANGVQQVTATLDGNTVNMNAPVATDDAGGTYNGGLILFYDPKGSPPKSSFTGTVDSTNGSVKVASNIANNTQAVAGLYLSALKWINGGTIPNSALAAMTAAGVTNPMTLTVV